LSSSEADPALGAVDLHPDAGEERREAEPERDEEKQRRELPDGPEAVLGEQPHREQPDTAIDEVLDEVGGPVALALEQRPGRGRAVDHHRTAGQKAEHRRQEHPVLEGLVAPAIGHQA
jgi:hypothetical protein